MKAKDLRQKSAAELAEALIEQKREQLNLRLARAQGQLKETHQFRASRRQVARILTILSEKNKAGKA